MRPLLSHAQRLGFLACVIGTSALNAQERMPESVAAPPSSMQNEFRLGILRHDPWSGTSRSVRQGQMDLHGQILLPFPFIDTRSPLIPRMQIGGSLNLAGRTSHAFAALAWTYDITSNLFAEAAFGGAIAGAPNSAHRIQAHRDMGCKPQFREAASLGYRLSANWSLITTAEHLSNGGLCTRNRGMTNFGAMLGYRF